MHVTGYGLFLALVGLLSLPVMAGAAPALSGGMVIDVGSQGNDSVQGGMVFGHHQRNSTHHIVTVRLDAADLQEEFTFRPAIGTATTLSRSTAGYRIVVAPASTDTWTADAASRIYVDPGGREQVSDGATAPWITVDQGTVLVLLSTIIGVAAAIIHYRRR